MSVLSISHAYPDGTVVQVEVEVDDDYPDSLAEAEARCLGLYRGAVPDMAPDGES